MPKRDRETYMVEWEDGRKSRESVLHAEIQTSWKTAQQIEHMAKIIILQRYGNERKIVSMQPIYD